MDRFTAISRALDRALDGLALRQRLHASNIANVDTPGYKRFDVEFRDALRTALNRNRAPVSLRATSSRHITRVGDPGQVNLHVYREYGTEIRNDGNNVDIDRELTALIRDQLWYNSLVETVNARFRRLQTVVGVRR